MSLFKLQQFVNENVTTPRLFFLARLGTRQMFLNDFDRKVAVLKSNLEKSWPEFDVTKTEYVVFEENENVYILRVGEKIASVHTYVSNHLLNSLIRYILLNGSDTQTFCDNIKATCFVLYFYEYVRKSTSNDINEITYRVCFLIEELIIKLINGSQSIYSSKAEEAKVILDLLRMALASERLILLGNKKKGINFRA